MGSTPSSAAVEPLNRLRLYSTGMSPITSHLVASDRLNAAAVSVESSLIMVSLGVPAVVPTVTLGGSPRGLSDLVQLDDGSWAIFAGASDGVVYRIDPLTGSIVWSVSLRRASCPDDSVAEPVVHLRRLATAAFKARHFTDVVYIGTQYSSLCSEYSTGNTVCALRASDGAVLWTFNYPKSYEVAPIAHSPAVDFAEDALYVSTDRPGRQPSLWAVSTLDGALIWSVDAGPARNGPQLVGDRIYVSGTYEVRAYDKAQGTEVWRLPLDYAHGTVIAPLVVNHSRYGTVIGVASVIGRVMLLHDQGRFPKIAWDVALPSAIPAFPTVASDDAVDRLYVGAADGHVHELSFDKGALVNSGPVNQRADARPAVVDLAFVHVDTDGDGVPDETRLLATTGYYLAIFQLPWS